MNELLSLSKAFLVAGLGILAGGWLSLWLGVGTKRFYKTRMALCITIMLSMIFFMIKTNVFLAFLIAQQNPFIGFFIITAVTYSAIFVFLEPIEKAFNRRINNLFDVNYKGNAKTVGTELRRDWEDLKKGWQEGNEKQEPTVKESLTAKEDDLYETSKSTHNKDSDRNYSEDLMDLGDAYIGKTHLMSPTERDVYKVLERGYGDRYHIFCQVRVVDLIQPNTQKYHRRSKEFASLFRQLSQWHFDYVLCEKDDFRIFCALELDDPSHKRADRMKRDRILDQACEVAGIRLERMKINHADKKIEVAPKRKQLYKAYNSSF